MRTCFIRYRRKVGTDYYPCIGCLDVLDNGKELTATEHEWVWIRVLAAMFRSPFMHEHFILFYFVIIGFPKSRAHARSYAELSSLHCIHVI